MQTVQYLLGWLAIPIILMTIVAVVVVHGVRKHNRITEGERLCKFPLPESPDGKKYCSCKTVRCFHMARTRLPSEGWLARGYTPYIADKCSEHAIEIKVEGGAKLFAWHQLLWRWIKGACTGRSQFKRNSEVWDLVDKTREMMECRAVKRPLPGPVHFGPTPRPSSDIHLKDMIVARAIS